MVERKDVEAALAARRELGQEYEADIVDAMVEKIEKRLEERLAERSPVAPRRHVDPRIPLGSIGLGIGATAVANGMGGAGIAVAIVAWIAIALVNLVYAWRR
jgi:hypothetical protein